jgi:hypothetical protein
MRSLLSQTPPFPKYKTVTYRGFCNELSPNLLSQDKFFGNYMGRNICCLAVNISHTNSCVLTMHFLMVVAYHHLLGWRSMNPDQTVFFPEFPLTRRNREVNLFVISASLSPRPPSRLSWQEFAWKRFRRIIPFYLIIAHSCC